MGVSIPACAESRRAFSPEVQGCRQVRVSSTCGLLRKPSSVGMKVRYDGERQYKASTTGIASFAAGCRRRRTSTMPRHMTQMSCALCAWLTPWLRGRAAGRRSTDRRVQLRP